MAPGARNKFGTPMFEPEVFQDQMYCVEASNCDIVGTVWSPEHCSPLPSLVMPQTVTFLHSSSCKLFIMDSVQKCTCNGDDFCNYKFGNNFNLKNNRKPF